MLLPCINPFNEMTVKLLDLTWRCKSPKFNLYHLQKTSTGFKKAMLTPKWGME